MTDIIYSEALLNSGENVLSSIEEIFPKKTHVFCHISLIYISGSPLVFRGSILRFRLMTAFLLGEWVAWERRNATWKAAVPHSHLKASLLRI